MENPFTKDEIKEAFTGTSDSLLQFFSSLSDEAFFTSYNRKWSAAENLEHLAISTEPVAKSLGFPKLTFNIFGRHKDRSRNYKELVAVYNQKLKEGAKASEKYSPGKKEQTKESLLEDWQNAAEMLLKNLDKWTERELDKYYMPHPILGKLTVREMLFFTIYHAQHHHQIVKSRVSA